MMTTATKTTIYLLFGIFAVLLSGCDTQEIIPNEIIDNNMPIQYDETPLVNTQDYYLAVLNQVVDTLHIGPSEGDDTSLTLHTEDLPGVQVVWRTDDPTITINGARLFRPIYTSDNQPIFVTVTVTVQAGDFDHEEIIDIDVPPSCRTDQSDLCSAESGTADSPYSIYNIEQLQAVNGALNARFVMRRDIDASVTSTWNDVGTDPTIHEGFDPLGTFADRFTGNFDGGNFTISSLSITRGGVDGIGLFKTVGPGARIHNMTLTDVNYSCFNSCGALVGYNYGATIEGVGVEGEIRGNGSGVGGIIGFHAGHLNDSQASVMMSGTLNEVGGMVGIMTPFNGVIPTISRASVYDPAGTKRISGGRNVGGLVGLISGGGIIRDTYTQITVERNTNTGGNSTTTVGGLIGWLADGTVATSYVAGRVTDGNALFGNVVNPQSLTGLYWDIEVTGQNQDSEGLARSTAQMLCPTTAGATCEGVTTYTNWSNSVWDFGTDADYPTLR